VISPVGGAAATLSAKDDEGEVVLVMAKALRDSAVSTKRI
jgi:hypothetical protein